MRDRLLAIFVLLIHAARSSDLDQDVPACFNGRTGVNVTQLASLVHAAPEECQPQITRDLCQRLDSVVAFPTAVQPPGEEVANVQSQLRFLPKRVVNIAFFILAFAAIANLKRLVRRLQAPGHLFLLHLDRKASERRTRELRDWVATSPGKGSWLHVMEERFEVRRGGASFLLVLLRAMELLLCLHTAFHWDYSVNLNDNDYLLTSVFALQAFVSLHWSESFVHIGSPSVARCLVNATSCRKIDHIVVMAECSSQGGVYSLLPADNELPQWFHAQMPIYSGPDLVGLWQPLVAHLIMSLHQHGTLVDKLLLQLRTAQQPDERFIQSFMRLGAGALGRHSHTLARFHMANVWMRELRCKALATLSKCIHRLCCEANKI